MAADLQPRTAMTAATLDRPNDDAGVWTAPGLAYGAFALACAGLLHPTALDMARIWATSSTYAHGFAAAPLALWMILRRGADGLAPASSVRLLPAVLAAAMLWLAGRAAGTALIEQAALVSLLIAGAGVVFGAAALRVWAFPLAFLVFMVPFGSSIIPALQTVTAQAAVAMLGPAGVEARLDGYLIETPAGAFEVAEACAGLRFLLTALMIASVFAYLSFETTAKRLSFLALALALAVSANILRAFLLILIAVKTDMRLAVGPDHLFFGLILYAATFAVLVWIGRRIGTDRAPHRRAAPKTAPSPWRASPVLGALAAVAAVALYAKTVVERPVERPAPASLSLISAPGWRILPPPQNWRASIDAADRTAGATYANRDNTVYTSIGYFTHDRPEAEILNYHARSWDGETWRRIGVRRADIALFGHGARMRFDVLAGPERRRLLTVSVYWWNGEIFTDRWRMKLAQMKAKLQGRNPPGGVVVLAASYRDDPSEALAAIRAFGADAEPFERWLARQNGG